MSTMLAESRTSYLHAALETTDWFVAQGSQGILTKGVSAYRERASQLLAIFLFSFSLLLLLPFTLVAMTLAQ